MDLNAIKKMEHLIFANFKTKSDFLGPYSAQYHEEINYQFSKPIGSKLLKPACTQV